MPKDHWRTGGDAQHPESRQVNLQASGWCVCSVCGRSAVRCLRDSLIPIAPKNSDQENVFVIGASGLCPCSLSSYPEPSAPSVLQVSPPKLHLSSSGTWTQSGEGRTERLACGSAFPPCSAHKGPEEIHAGPQARGWLLGHVAGRQNTVSSSFPQPALEIFTRNTSAFLPQMCSGFS